MADTGSDLYQHLLSIESVHNISPSKFNMYYNLKINNLNALNNINGSLTSSATSTTASTNSISSLSTSASNDEDMNWSIEGGFQRALVLNFDGNQDNNHQMADRYAGLYNDDNGDNNNDEDPDEKSTSFSFESWMDSYKNQPQQIINRSRHRNRKYVQRRKNKLIFHPAMNEEISLELNRLRSDLPFNPHKSRQIIKSKQMDTNNTPNPNRPYDNILDGDDQHENLNVNQIEIIQQKIMVLQNRLNDIRDSERMEQKLSNWKQFKTYWKEWRLCDLFEYLQRINNRKYFNKKYLPSFELFYTEWMNIYKKDEHQRFKSHIFIGKNLCLLDHNDLIQFGITLKEDRREILMHIQRLNGFRSHV